MPTRIFASIIAAGALGAAAAPAVAQPKPGDRTTSPEQMLTEIGDADADYRQAVAQAAKHPLGSLANPVRVGGPDGQRAYVARLRCASGDRPKLGQRRSGGVGAFGTITDLVPLDCGTAAPGRYDLVVDMYHAEHREPAAPPGFAIDPL
jgi:hypothetical protein